MEETIDYAFASYFSLITIQISRLNCNQPMGHKDFNLIKRLTLRSPTAFPGSGLLISAYFLRKSLLQCYKRISIHDFHSTSWEISLGSAPSIFFCAFQTSRVQNNSIMQAPDWFYYFLASIRRRAQNSRSAITAQRSVTIIAGINFVWPHV